MRARRGGGHAVGDGRIAPRRTTAAPARRAPAPACRSRSPGRSSRLSFGVVAQGAGFSAGGGDRDVGDRLRRLGAVHRDRDPRPRAARSAPRCSRAALVNSRFLPMGVALGPSLPGGPTPPRAAGADDRRCLVGDRQPRRRHVRPLAAVRLERGAVRRLGRRHDRRRARRQRARRPGRDRTRRGLPGVLPRAAHRGARPTAGRGSSPCSAALIALVLVPVAPARRAGARGEPRGARRAALVGPRGRRGAEAAMSSSVARDRRLRRRHVRHQGHRAARARRPRAAAVVHERRDPARAGAVRRARRDPGARRTASASRSARTRSASRRAGSSRGASRSVIGCVVVAALVTAGLRAI